MAGSANKEATTGDAPATTSEKAVKYIGTSDVREIDNAAWKSIGIDQKKVVWDRSNRWTIPASEFSKEALKYLDEDDDGFAVVDV